MFEVTLLFVHKCFVKGCVSCGAVGPLPHGTTREAMKERTSRYCSGVKKLMVRDVS